MLRPFIQRFTEQLRCAWLCASCCCDPTGPGPFPGASRRGVCGGGEKGGHRAEKGAPVTKNNAPGSPGVASVANEASAEQEAPREGAPGSSARRGRHACFSRVCLSSVGAAGSCVEVNRWTRSRTLVRVRDPVGLGWGPGMALIARCKVVRWAFSLPRGCHAFSPRAASEALPARGPPARCFLQLRLERLPPVGVRLSAFQLPKPRRDLRRQRRSVLGLTVS